MNLITNRIKPHLVCLLKLQPLVVAALLQFAPLAKYVQSNPVLAQSPLAIVLQWTVGAAALLGACHAVSGASASIIGLRQYNGVLPVGTVQSNVLATNGVIFKWRIATTNVGSDAANDLYNALNLPPGLSIDTKMGAQGYITNTPVVSGVYTVTLVADNSNCNCPVYFTSIFTVVDNPTGKPSMQTIVSNQTVVQGATANFTTTANGTAPITYQWRRNGTNLPGLTQPLLSLSNVTAADTGLFTVILSNSVGSVTSAPPANLWVVAPYLLVTNTLTNVVTNFANLELDQVPGATYKIEQRDLLTNGNWLVFSNLPSTSTSAHRVVKLTVTNSSKIYRTSITIP